jgi:hypothetical protein
MFCHFLFFLYFTLYNVKSVMERKHEPWRCTVVFQHYRVACRRKLYGNITFELNWMTVSGWMIALNSPIFHRLHTFWSLSKRLISFTLSSAVVIFKLFNIWDWNKKIFLMQLKWNPMRQKEKKITSILLFLSVQR